ncbi:MAG TPA: SGNH/GDSL hydrolase family protein [Candidatus Binatia bacterium]
MSRARSILPGLAAAAFSILVSVLLLEVVLHVVGYPRTKTSHQRFYVEHDPQRGWRNVPNADGWFSTDEYDVHLQYNSRGFRGPERSYEKPPGTYRVVILGDSFIEGYSVNLEDRVSERLEKLLSEQDPSRRYEVIALGTAGYSTDQELIWLESEGVKYQPDVVVVMFYMNDVWFNGQSKYWRGEKPAYVLENGELKLTNVPVPDARPKKKKRETGRGLKHWIRANSKIYALFSLALENSPGLRRAATALGLVSPRDEDDDDNGGPRVADELSVFQKEEPPATMNGWRMTGAILERMNEVANEAGAKLIVFHIPFKGVVYEQDWAPILARLGLPQDQLDPSRVKQRFDEICANYRLDCIEPTEEYRRVAAELGDGGRLYYVQDNHWNAGGHELAAEILARRIRELQGR